MKIILVLVFAALGFFGLISYSDKKSEVKTASANAVEETVQPETLPADDKNTKNTKSPVLVELFTSEGCSSCPSADQNLIGLNEKQSASQAEVITLALHVDYWNRLGWKDVFSAAQYSERQSYYSSKFNLDGVYTPQMVVDGKTQFVGSDAGATQKAISSAAQNAKANVELSTAINKLQVKISGVPEHSTANVYVAVAEDNLSTAVKNGENGGKTLQHTSVVRELKIVGTVAANKNSFTAEMPFELQSGWNKRNLKFVVFVQNEQTGQIIGVNQIRL